MKMIQTVAAIFVLLAVAAHATEGVNLIGIGPRQQGTAGAGVASARDSTWLILNPAGLTDLDRGVDASFQLFGPSRSVDSTANPAAGKQKDDSAFFIPSISATFSPGQDQQSTFGIGLYGSSGMGVDYDQPRVGFSEVSGMNLSVAPVEYREGDDLRNTARKLPGLTSYGNITLRWGVCNDEDFLTWLHSVAPDNQAGPTGIVRYDVTITLLDDAGNASGPVWTLINAWPVSYTVPDLSAMGGEVAIQSLELCHEGLWLTTPGGAAGSPSTI